MTSCMSSIKRVTLTFDRKRYVKVKTNFLQYTRVTNNLSNSGRVGRVSNFPFIKTGTSDIIMSIHTDDLGH